MPKPTRRLGRGLDSLVSDLRSADPAQAPQGQPLTPAPPGKRVGGDLPTVRAMLLPVTAINPNPQQPRRTTGDDNVASLAKSIQQSGMLQPIAVRHVADGYQIIAGERRWRAARSLGMAEVPVIVRDATDEQMLEFALIENIQREDLNAIDRAEAYRQFCDRFKLKAEEVAARLCEDRTTVVNYLRLLDLAEPIKTFVAEGKLSMGHARCLLGIKNEPERLRLAESAAQNDLSVRALEEVVRRRRTSAKEPALETNQPERVHRRDLERRFEEAVKTKVTIHEGRRKGTGRVMIEYYSLDDFDRIAELLGVTLE